MPEKEKRSMAAVHSVMKKSSETWVRVGVRVRVRSGLG